MRQVRHMSGAIECVSPRMWKGLPDFVKNRSEERRALVAARDQRRSVESRETSDVQPECTLLVHLVQPRRCIKHERLSHLRREFFPHARSECDGLDKLLRAQLRSARLQRGDDSLNPLVNRSQPGIVSEEPYEGRLVNSQACEQIRPRCRQL